jgi:hypothetical protein
VKKMGLNDAKNIAGRQYVPGENSTNDEVKQGLQETYEQVMDNYMEGTVDGMIEKEKGKDIPLTDL